MAESKVTFSGSIMNYVLNVFACVWYWFTDEVPKYVAPLIVVAIIVALMVFAYYWYLELLFHIFAR